MARASWSATLPMRSTGTIALTSAPRASWSATAWAVSAGSRLPLSSESTKTGVAPQYVIAFVVAAKVIDEVTTAEPGRTPMESRARCRAPVPDDSATAWPRSVYAARSASKPSTSGPSGATQPERIARTRASSSAWPTSGEDM